MQFSRSKNNKTIARCRAVKFFDNEIIEFWKIGFAFLGQVLICFCLISGSNIKHKAAILYMIFMMWVLKFSPS